FSKLVILGEGDSEQIVLPKLLEHFAKDIDGHSISVVPLGGRHVNHFWRLLNSLKIPFVTLLDFDIDRNGGGFGRMKYVVEQLILMDEIKSNYINEKLFLISPTGIANETLIRFQYIMKMEKQG
ncbi:MAG: ATP-dependent endonuclease, partial [Shewanella xiamenensis]|nr:ATP-dependent endonuclease [Shewanella xiamenensis]